MSGNRALVLTCGCAIFRTLVVGLLVVASAPRATAAPMLLYGGTLDATLRLYDYQHTDDFSVGFRILRAEYELGVDFMPAVPLSNQLDGVPYTGCVDYPFSFNAAFFGPCGGNATALTSSGFQDSSPLQDGCSPPYYNPGKVVIVVRGNCTFSERWQELEGAGYIGVLVQNNAPGILTGGIGLLPPPPGTTEPTIPFMLITQEVANELRGGSFGYDLSFSRDPYRYFPIVQMYVTWTPLTNPDLENPPLDPGIVNSNQPPDAVPAVPEPGSLTLLLLAGALCGVRRAKPRGAEQSTSRCSWR
jgi:hypothetical protein